MRFVSLFAGVGGFDLGFEQAGMTCVGQVEIDKNARKILEKQFPNVPKWDDVQTAKEWADEQQLVGRVDLVCGGFPCQDLSVAGKRAGLAGARSGLFYDAVDFATHVKAKWIVLENVPGLLSSNRGADFLAVISNLRNAGFHYVEWRVFNSQFYGVPQRRRRIFIVASTTNPSRFPIFVERESSEWDSSPGNEEGKNSSRETSVSVGEDRILGSDIIGTLAARDYKGVGNQYVAENKLIVEPDVYRMQAFGQYTEDDTASALKARDYKDATDLVIATPIQDAREIDKKQNGLGIGDEGDPMFTLDRVSQPGVVLYDGTRVGDFRTHEGVAPTVISRYGTGGNNVPILEQDVIAVDIYNGTLSDINQTLRVGSGSIDQTGGVIIGLDGEHNGSEDSIGTLKAQGDPARVAIIEDSDPISFHPTQSPISGNVSPALGTTTRGMGVFVKASRATSSETPETWREDEVSPTLNTFDNGGEARATVIPIQNSVVRRLTPIECERLQGFPDDWTAGQADSHRYKQMGNAVTVNVVKAVGDFIMKAQ